MAFCCAPSLPPQQPDSNMLTSFQYICSVRACTNGPSSTRLPTNSVVIMASAPPKPGAAERAMDSGTRTSMGSTRSSTQKAAAKRGGAGRFSRGAMRASCTQAGGRRSSGRSRRSTGWPQDRAAQLHLTHAGLPAAEVTTQCTDQGLLVGGELGDGIGGDRVLELVYLFGGQGGNLGGQEGQDGLRVAARQVSQAGLRAAGRRAGRRMGRQAGSERAGGGRSL